MWYAVAARHDANPENHVWTVSNDPKRPAWDTDSGCDGYGLPKVIAQYLADSTNWMESAFRDGKPPAFDAKRHGHQGR